MMNQGWAANILWAAGIVTALSVLWSKVIHPGLKAAKTADAMLPLLKELTIVFAGSPGIFHVIRAMSDQFRSDSGSTLRDVVNRLEDAADVNARASEVLKVGVESSRQLAERDRQQLDRLILLLDRLTIRVDAVSASGVRIEQDRAEMAKDLETRSTRLDESVARVAADLAASHTRADDVAAHHPPGSAADAASQSPKP